MSHFSQHLRGILAKDWEVCRAQMNERGLSFSSTIHDVHRADNDLILAETFAMRWRMRLDRKVRDLLGGSDGV
jgi:hypothetical protein